MKEVGCDALHSDVSAGGHAGRLAAAERALQQRVPRTARGGRTASASSSLLSLSSARMRASCVSMASCTLSVSAVGSAAAEAAASLSCCRDPNEERCASASTRRGSWSWASDQMVSSAPRVCSRVVRASSWSLSEVAPVCPEERVRCVLANSSAGLNYKLGRRYSKCTWRDPRSLSLSTRPPKKQSRMSPGVENAMHRSETSGGVEKPDAQESQ
jgi:hypothetical protein